MYFRCNSEFDLVSPTKIFFLSLSLFAALLPNFNYDVILKSIFLSNNLVKLFNENG